jgi:hypothetical protein
MVDALLAIDRGGDMQRTGLAAGAALLVVVAALVAASSGIAGPRVAHRSLACTKHITVVFDVYQYFPEPVSNGCWGYQRVVQNTSTFHICHWDGAVRAYGVQAVFDDTNPLHDWATESQNVWYCANYYTGVNAIYAEYMAARSASWCGAHGYASPCWRRNAGSPAVASVRYFAELYSDDYHVLDQLSQWQATGYGANPANSRPTINIRPDAYNNRGTTYYMRSHITQICNLTGDGQYMSMYAGPSGGAGTATDLSGTDDAAINAALDACTT